MWFTEVRAVAELKKQRLALERIATCLEELLLQQGKSTGTGIRSMYTAKDEVEGQVLVQTDEEMAQLEAEWMERVTAVGEEEAGEEDDA